LEALPDLLAIDPNVCGSRKAKDHAIAADAEHPNGDLLLG
jgi:hypothetical protein